MLDCSMVPYHAIYIIVNYRTIPYHLLGRCECLVEPTACSFTYRTYIYCTIRYNTIPPCTFECLVHSRTSANLHMMIQYHAYLPVWYLLLVSTCRHILFLSQIDTLGLCFKLTTIMCNTIDAYIVLTI